MRIVGEFLSCPHQKKKTEKTKKQTETKRHPKLRLQKFRDSRVGIFARQVSTSHQAVEKCLQETSHNNSNNDKNLRQRGRQEDLLMQIE